MDLEVGFLSFPVSFLHRDINGFYQQAIKKDVVSQVETDKPISHHRHRPSSWLRELDLVLEITKEVSLLVCVWICECEVCVCAHTCGWRTEVDNVYQPSFIFFFSIS